MIKVGRSLSQLVDSKRSTRDSVSARGGPGVNREKSFFSFEKQGIRKSLKGDHHKTDSYQGPKISHISITPKSAVTIQPPKKVCSFTSISFFLFSLFFVLSYLRVARDVVRSLSCAFEAAGRFHLSLSRARAVSPRGSCLGLLRNVLGFHDLNFI
jgi:hypothetical protein